MNREEKATAIAEIGSELGDVNAVYAVDYRGISVPAAAELRTKLREADASFSIVKNRLAKRAVAEAGIDGLEEHLVGPTALTYVRGDAVLAAKAIADFAKANENLTFKGGVLDGAPLDPDQFKTIARLPGVDVLRGQLVAMTASPLTGLVRGLNGLLSGLASQLGQIADQGLVGQGTAEQPAATEEPEAEAPAAEPEPEADAEPEPDAEPATEADAEPEPETSPEPEPDEGAEDTETETEPEQTEDSAPEGGESEESKED